MPARLAGLAGGVCFRSGLAPRVHSSWPREGEARQDPGWPQLRRGPAPSRQAPRGPAGKRCCGPAARGSREPDPALREVAKASPGLHPRRTPWPPPAPSGPPTCPVAAARSTGLWAPRRPSSLSPRPRPAHRLQPPQPPPARTPARQRHPVASRNLTPSSASCAPPRPAANFLSPTSQRAGRPDGRARREGSPRRAAGPPQLPAGRPVGGSNPRGALGRRPCTGSAWHTQLRPTRGAAATARAGGPAPPGEGPPRRRVTRGAARPARRTDGPARAPPPPPRLQGPAKFLTCSGRCERESERARAAAAAAAAEPRERSRPSLRREATPEQLHTPRPRRRPPRPPSAPAARWLRARVWSRGTFCLGAGERPPPPGSPPPAFPTRTSHSSSRLFPLVH